MPSLQIKPRLKIHYLEHNPQGTPTVLLLHGLGATGGSWAFQFPALTDAGFHILAPDTRGFGQSTYPGGGVQVSDLAADLAYLLEALQTGPCHVVGISMGGTIALQLALEEPHRIKKLILVNTFARLRPRTPSLWLYFTVRFILVHTLGLPAQARAVARRIFPLANQQAYRQELIQEICQAKPAGYRAAMRALARFNVSHRLAEIRIPTLVVSGENDTTVPMSAQGELAQGISGSRHVFIPRAGHAVIIDQPERFNNTLLEFLQEV